jgi:MFS family permease
VTGGRPSRVFPALQVRNYRLWFAGRVVSVSGTWMQSVALAWLVLDLTGNGVTLGLVTALEFLPVLLVGPWAGLIADRLDKRRLLLGAQGAAAAVALSLGVLTLTGAVRLWMIFLTAVFMGCVRAVDTPTRHSFVLEMVRDEHLTNAVTLNSVLVNAARVVGPGVAGVLIALSGTAVCFLVNAGTYLAVMVALAAMRTTELRPAPATARGRRQLREGFEYVWTTPALRVPLVVMAVVGTLALEWRVTLPLFAQRTLAGGAGAYGALMSAMGAGAVLGGLVTAARSRAGPRRLMVAGLAFGAVILAVSLAPSLPLAVATMVPFAVASIWFIATANATLQLAAAPEFRGRVMALYAVAFLGSTPIGGPIVGVVGEHLGARAALALGGVATLGAALWGLRALARHGVEVGVEAGADAVGGPAIAAASDGGRATAAPGHL